MPLKTRHVLLLALTLCFIPRPAQAQDDPIVERMKKDITYLASDELEGRGVGTKGLDMAADYIADQFKQAGLKPGGVNGTWFQPFPFSTSAQLEGPAKLVLEGPQGQKITLKPGVDFQVVGSSAAGKVSAPLVFAGYGVRAKGITYDDYAGLDTKGKAVVAVRRLPRWDSKDMPFDGANKELLAALDNKQTTAKAQGAAALILVNDLTELPGDGLLNFQGTKGLATAGIPFVHVKRSVIDDIVRSSTGTGLLDTEKVIAGDLKPRSAPLTGWTAHLEVKVKRQENIVKNVIGVVEGSGPLANETIVVGAHYDHLGYGGFGSLAPKEKGKIHHGADDNGSGTTTVIELARRFGAMKNREGRRMVFMTFTAEESGLVGSRHYTREPLFPLKDTAMMFNLDMVGRLKAPDPKTGKSKLLVLGTGSSKGFEELVMKLSPPEFDVVKDPGGVFGASDHFSFYQQKIPVLFFWTGTHSDYHRPTDTSDKINVPGMKRIADYSERILNELRTDPKRPDYIAIKSTFTGGGPKGPRMGILPDYEFGGKGVRIEGVSAGGPAESAGIKKGDVIIEIGGKAVSNVDGYMSALKSQKSGAAVDVKILRDAKELMLKVTPK